MSSAHAVILAIVCIVVGGVLQAIRPGDSIALLLVGAGSSVLTVGFVAKKREADKAKKAVVDLERTATNLRAEIQSITGTIRKP